MTASVLLRIALAAPPAISLCLAAPAAPGKAESATRTVHNGSLYTRPDPASPGGLRGRVVAAAGAGGALAVLAKPRDDFKGVYFAAPAKDGAFAFSGLPAGRYDLVVVCEGALYEGLRLTRKPDALSPEDRDAVAKALSTTNPFFETKRCERMEGRPGETGEAVVLLQEMRMRPVTLQSAEVRRDIRIRSVKIALLADVGAGWSVTETRELLRTEVGPHDAVRTPLPCVHTPALAGHRVADAVAELGVLALPAPVPPGAADPAR